MPTVLGLAGKEPNETQGTDLSKALVGRQTAPSPPQYSESLHSELEFGMAPLKGIRLDEWTYIRAPRAELYNRATDPRELRNLLEVEASSTAKAQAAKLDALLTKIGEDSKRFGVVSEARPLDQQTVQMLQALGYMGDSDAPEDLGGMDPKDGLPIFDDVNKAIALTQGGDCTAAIRLLASVLERLPSHVRARNTLAKCEVRIGNLEAAQENYLRSLAHEPQQPHVFLQLARLDIAQGRNESARRHVSKALELLPDSVEAIMLMGYLDLSEGQPAKATRWYDRAIAADPTRPDAYMQQGDLYFRKRKFEQAQGWYEKALGVAPGSYVPSLQAGLCALYLGDPSTAERRLLEASQADPARWQPLYSLACARVRQDDSDGALSYLEAAAAKGFANHAQLQSDPCMASLSNEPRFMSLLATSDGPAPR
jgi:Tfp pilus assembly protein PilF